MNTLLFRVGVLLLALLCCACFSHAQVDCFYKTLSVSRVQGQVFDPLGQTIPSVVVLLKKDRKEVSRTTTNDEGRFFIKAADGRYVLQTEAQGFEQAFLDINVGNDLTHVFHPTNLWLILATGAGAPRPVPTSNHKQFLPALSEYKKQTQGLIQTHATQK